MGKTKITIYRCDSHDHKVVYVDDSVAISNDYCVENIYRLAEHLEWNIETIKLNYDEFERRFS